MARPGFEPGAGMSYASHRRPRCPRSRSIWSISTRQSVPKRYHDGRSHGHSGGLVPRSDAAIVQGCQLELGRRVRCRVRGEELGLRCDACQLTGLSEGHESPALLVIELESDGAQAVPERQRRRLVQERVGIVGALEVVVRDACAEMMDMVQTDVPGEELQHPWQPQI